MYSGYCTTPPIHVVKNILGEAARPLGDRGATAVRAPESAARRALREATGEGKWTRERGNGDHPYTLTKRHYHWLRQFLRIAEGGAVVLRKKTVDVTPTRVEIPGLTQRSARSAVPTYGYSGLHWVDPETRTRLLMQVLEQTDRPVYDGGKVRLSRAHHAIWLANQLRHSYYPVRAQHARVVLDAMGASSEDTEQSLCSEDEDGALDQAPSSDSSSDTSMSRGASIRGCPRGMGGGISRTALLRRHWRD